MGIAKLYGQKSSGTNINGIIKDYHAYAGENISAGDLVEYINGVAGQTTETSSSVQLAGSYTGYAISAVQLDENRVFIAHSYSNQHTLYAMVVTIYGTTITAGADTALSADYSYRGFYVCATLLQNGNVLVLHTKTQNSGLMGSVCTTDGTTITKGTDKELTTQINSSVAMSTEVLENGDVFLAHSYNNSNYLYGVIIKVSGTSITYGSDTALSSSSGSGKAVSTALLSGNKVFAAHSYNSDNLYLRGIVCEISNTTITVGGDTALSSETNTGYKISTQLLENGNVFIAHSAYQSMYLFGTVCTIDGTTITAGTITALNNHTGNDVLGDIATVLYKGKVVIFHGAGNGPWLNGIACSVDGTTITAGTDTALNSTTTYTGYQISSLLLKNGTIFVAHSYGGSYYLYAQIFGIDEVNNVPTNNIVIPTYEQQVRKTTTSQFDGVAKTSGVGGTETVPKDLVSIYTIYKLDTNFATRDGNAIMTADGNTFITK